MPASAKTEPGSGRFPDPVPVIERGLAVFPIPPGGRNPASRYWAHECVSDPELARRIWPAGANIGVGCRASNLVGIDLDRHDPNANGIAAFDQLCRRHGQPWPDTLTVRTPRNGLHLYFRAPAGKALASTINQLGAGIDTRAPGRRLGGYLIGPGSIVNGAVYIIKRDLEIAELPGWLADLLAIPERTGARINARRSTTSALRRGQLVPGRHSWRVR